MIKRNNKKGFTIVELVIVIAVIAILAAVLIPTFAGIIRKANISADTQLVKNMNTALTADEAINGKPDSFSDVIAIVRDAGYVLSAFNPTTEGCYVAWDKENNQLLLIDGKNDKFEVIYSVKEPSASENWYFAVDSEEAEKALKDHYGETVKIEMALTDAATLAGTINKDGEQELYVDESLVISADKVIDVNNENASVTLKFGGASLTTEGTIAKIPLNVTKGQLIVEDAVVGGAGSFTNEHGTFSTAVGFDGYSKLTLDGCNIRGTGNAVAGSNKDDGPAEVTIIDCTLSSDNVGLQLATWGTATVTNTNIDCPNPFFASYGAVINVESGKFNSTSDCMIELHDNTTNAPEGRKCTTVNIKNGEFTFTTFAIFNGSAKIVITGGTFNGANYLEYFATEEANNAITGGATISISGNTVTISK